MKKCIIISDSFKGTLSSFDIMRLFKNSTKEVFPECEVLAFPIADGGEGTMEAFSTILDGVKVSIDAIDSNNNQIYVTYFMSQNVAYMDAATCIYLATTSIKDPKITTSYGIGIMIKDAIRRGCKKIILGLGGTSTNDGGCGLLSALGVSFINFKGEKFTPTGGTLDEISSFDASELNNLINGVEVVAMCDVTNPLLYANGATYIYASQKGASIADLEILDKKMEHYHKKVIEKGYEDFSSYPGAGAAGGIGYAIKTFLNGKLESGISVLLDTLNFEEKLSDVDVIFTGEGKIDDQTSKGKVVDGIRKVASKHNIPVVVIAGGADLTSESLIDNGIDAIITTTRRPMNVASLKDFAEDFYTITVKNTLRLIKLGEKLK